MAHEHDTSTSTEAPATPGPAAGTSEPEAPVTPPGSAPVQEPETPNPHPDEAPGPDETPVQAPGIEPTTPAGDPEAPVTPASDESTDHEHQLERDLEELTAKAEKADEYLELAKRTKADFENYRKRAAREAAAAQERGIAKLAKELLPAVDNLDRAVQAAESAVGAQANGTQDTLVSGIKLVHADVVAALQRVGIERYSPQGEPFDPTRHEALAQQPVEGAQPGTIVEVYQQGYLLGEVVIRPARVVVAG